MPFYEYQCSACGHHHEELQKITDGVLRKCSACGRSTLKRLMSAPAFRLKGGGWYETDFKGDKDSQRNLAGDKEPAPPTPKDDKTVAKPAVDAKPAAEAKPAADSGTAAGAAASKPATTARPKAPARRSSLRRRRPRT